MDFTKAASPRLAVEVDWAPSYELLVSLTKWTTRESEATYDEGPQWFDKVRTKMSPELLAALGEVHDPHGSALPALRRSKSLVLRVRRISNGVQPVKSAT